MHSLDTSTWKRSSMEVLPNPRSLRFLNMNLLNSFQYLPWVKMTPGMPPFNSQVISSDPGLEIAKLILYFLFGTVETMF